MLCKRDEAGTDFLSTFFTFFYLNFQNFKDWITFRSDILDTLRDRGSLLFPLDERREEPLLATARFFDLAAVHGQGRINFKKTAFDKFKRGFEFAHGRREPKRCPFTRPLSISAGWCEATFLKSRFFCTNQIANCTSARARVVFSGTTFRYTCTCTCTCRFCFHR